MVSLNPLPPPPEIEDAKMTMEKPTTEEHWINLGLCPPPEIIEEEQKKLKQFGNIIPPNNN
jgi:hypothetical protein